MEIRSRGGDSVAVSYREEGPWKELAADRILLSVGRRPDMTKVLAEDCRVELKHGRPIVKGTYRTTQEHVYAIGDTVAKTRLALSLIHISPGGIFLASARLQNLRQPGISGDLGAQRPGECLCD